MSEIQCKQLCKSFQQGDQIIKGLDHLDMEIQKGEFICLSGPSGSGKTTLLNAIGGLDSIDSGEISIDDLQVHTLNKSEKTHMRLNNIGFVFQAYNLIPVLTAQENVEFVMQLQGVREQDRAQKARETLAEVGLQGMENRRPAQLSGGQQQRVAVARAIASSPRLILADEPTANLDSKTAIQLIELFLSLNQKHNITFVIASHDERVKTRCRRLITMVDGKIERDDTQS